MSASTSDTEDMIARLVDRVQQIAVMRPGDAVVFTIDEDAPPEQIQQMANAVRTWFAEYAPGINTLLATGVRDIFVARASADHATEETV